MLAMVCKHDVFHKPELHTSSQRRHRRTDPQLWAKRTKVIHKDWSVLLDICSRIVHQAAKLVAAILRVARATAGLAEVMAAYRQVYDSRHLHPAKNRDQLRNHTLGNRVWATFTFTFFARGQTYTHKDTNIYIHITLLRSALPLGAERSIVMCIVYVCLFLCVCLSARLSP